MANNPLSRRQFIQLGTGAIAATTVATNILQPHLLSASPRRLAPSDTIRFASIGTGIRGCEHLEASLNVPGVQCVAVCDLYDSRHTAARESVKNPSVLATRDYRSILDRKDVDSVLIATMDHQHRHIFEDAVAAGKDVYCEKPMSHTVEDGFAMIGAAQKHGRMVAVGSQRVSSILYAKAKEIYDSGKLGEVFSINAYWDRNTPSGAWVYPIPPDASEKTIDWNTFIGSAPKRPFDPVRFFRWRCFTDYGEGLGGDLFVHLLSGIHFITGTNQPAQRAQSSGGLYHFKDGRDFPDLIETLYDYPNFRVTLRCNLNNAGGEFIGFYGTKGTMIIKDSTLTYRPEDTRPQPEDYSIYGWPKALRDQYLENWHEEHPEPKALNWNIDEMSESYTVPAGYSDTVDHQANFYNAVRTRKPVVENEVFGNNTAIGCHLANFSYFNKTVAVWDPSGRKIVKG
ncbi:MAG TPA: Gfo/Idh/MocA family oxidoreductase [Candidatus Sulfotelmatobacter sp.]|nr:Gfo/Idh/MocA family oxidoreductase [Candidatus Sulfotelmatobacter sp.]